MHVNDNECNVNKRDKRIMMKYDNPFLSKSRFLSRVQTCNVNMQLFLIPKIFFATCMPFAKKSGLIRLSSYYTRKAFQ